jgi:threonine dehydrogenase-like Zn-dependent dehydrogenase
VRPFQNGTLTGVVEKPIPEPGPEEAIVRTTAALICTSDVHTFAFDDVPEAFAMMTTKDDGIIKPLITFG